MENQSQGKSYALSDIYNIFDAPKNNRKSSAKVRCKFFPITNFSRTVTKTIL